jgi:hypothetical protein
MELAIFAIALDEERYLDEWLQYHTDLGFTKFIIYDNSANHRLREFESDSVKIIYFPGKAMQIPAYNHFLENFASEFDYAIALDIDEFLVIHNDITLNKFIKLYVKSAGTVIHWKFFGSNGHLTYSNLPVLERFTKCQPDCSDHFKTLIDCKKVVRYTNPHLPDLTVDGEIFELTGELVTDHASEINTTDIAQINHYFCKSWEEFKWKINRGRITINTEPRSTNDFFWSNRNDVYDDSAIVLRNKNNK